MRRVGNLISSARAALLTRSAVPFLPSSAAVSSATISEIRVSPPITISSNLSEMSSATATISEIRVSPPITISSNLTEIMEVVNHFAPVLGMFGTVTATVLGGFLLVMRTMNGYAAENIARDKKADEQLAAARLERELEKKDVVMREAAEKSRMEKLEAAEKSRMELEKKDRELEKMKDKIAVDLELEKCKGHSAALVYEIAFREEYSAIRRKLQALAMADSAESPPAATVSPPAGSR
jgi:hypothetical protein